MRRTDLRWTTLLLATIVCLVAFAWWNRFVQDDAFISFRYARNLVEGHGLVFNPGERVEGYTNFLWTLLMAVPHVAGWSPIHFAFTLSLALFSSTLFFVYRLGVYLLKSREAALVTTVLVGLNYSFSSYATGGLETPLVTALVVILAYTLARADDTGAWGTATLIFISLVCAALVMTRPDASIFVAIAFAIVAAHRSSVGSVKGLGALALPFALVMAAWLVWKISYYGHVLPNTFWAKAASGYIPFGVYLVLMFFGSYFALPAVMLLVMSRGRVRVAGGIRWAMVAATIVLWAGYVAASGGDFMEYRMMIPVLPFVMLLGVHLTLLSTPNPKIRALIFASVVVSSLVHAATFDKSPFRRGIHSIGQLRDQITGPEAGLAAIGKNLAEAFRGAPHDLFIATSAAGAIPYYTNLATLDLLGLTDEWLARNGEISGRGAGHRRRAPLHYLVQRNVHLVLGHPWVLASDSSTKSVYGLADFRGHALLSRFVEDPGLPSQAAMIEIPIGSGRRLAVLYLTPHTGLDRVIAQQGWRVVPIETPSSPARM